MAIAPAMKMRKIQGEQTWANRLSFSNPRMATVVKRAPMIEARTTQPADVGSTASREGALSPNPSPTAVADTEIIAPARMQYSTALAIL